MIVLMLNEFKLNKYRDKYARALYKLLLIKALQASHDSMHVLLNCILYSFS